MKRSILTAFAAMAIAASATFAQYYGYWSPVTVFEPAVSTNIPGDYDLTFTLVYRISVSGDSFSWTPDATDTRAADACSSLVKQAEVVSVRDTGYLFIKFNIFQGDRSENGSSDYCSGSYLPWSWICASTGGIVNVEDMWIQLDGAAPWQTSEGPVPLMVDEYTVYAALQNNKYAYEMPSWDYTPVWQPNFKWWVNECEPTEPPCIPTIDWDYVQPATGLVKIFGLIDPRNNGEVAVFDLISSAAKQTPLNRVIGADCCTAQVFIPQTFKGGLITLGSEVMAGVVTDWYNKWENCPENIIVCLDLRLDSAMTKAHNECAYTPDQPGGGCTPGQTTIGRGGFGLW